MSNKIDVYEIIEDFNELCDFRITSQKGRMITIYDLQLEEEFTVSVIEWLERIHDYYYNELPQRSEITLDFTNRDYDYEFSVYYYETLLEIVHAVEKERTLYA